MDNPGGMRFRFVLLALFGLIGVSQAADLMVSSYFGDTVARFSLTDGAYKGTLTGGTLDGPLATHLGSDGKLYVASELTNSILRYDPTTGAYLDTFASGTGMNHPTGFAWDASGNMLVGNFNSNDVSKYSPTGTYLGSLVPAGGSGLSGADVGTALGPDGNLYVPSFNSNEVLKFNPTSGAFVGRLNAGGLTTPRTILFHDNLVWVASETGNKVLRYNMDGSLHDTFIAAGSGGLSAPVGMAFGGDGFLYVTSGRSQVLKFNDQTGVYAGVFASTNLNGGAFLTVVPEPGTVAAVGVGCVAMLRRRKRGG